MLREIQTHKRLKIMLFIRTKHNMQIFRVIPFIKLQNDKQQLNGEKWDGEQIHLSSFGWAMSCAWKNVGITMTHNGYNVIDTWHKIQMAQKSDGEKKGNSKGPREDIKCVHFMIGPFVSNRRALSEVIFGMMSLQ